MRPRTLSAQRTWGLGAGPLAIDFLEASVAVLKVCDIFTSGVTSTRGDLPTEIDTALAGRLVRGSLVGMASRFPSSTCSMNKKLSRRGTRLQGIEERGFCGTACCRCDSGWPTLAELGGRATRLAAAASFSSRARRARVRRGETAMRRRRA